MCYIFVYVNALLNIYHKLVHKLSNAVLAQIHRVEITPIHKVAITLDHIILKVCANVIRTYKHHNSIIVRMAGAAHGRLYVSKMFRRVAVP